MEIETGTLPQNMRRELVQKVFENRFWIKRIGEKV